MAAAAVALALALTAPTALGATADTPYDVDHVESADPFAFGRWAERLASAGDVTGDGISALLYALDNPKPQGARAEFGGRIGRAGGPHRRRPGRGHRRSTGHDTPAGCRVQDPVPAGCKQDEGEAFILNGATRELVRTLNLPTADQEAVCPANNSVCGTFGMSVQGPGEVNGDGVPDQVVTAGSLDVHTGSGTACGQPESNGCNESQGAMYLFSGADGELIRRIDDPLPQQGATFGFQDAALLSPGDVNGDGPADIYANGFAQNNPDNGVLGIDEGLAWVFDGKTGEVLYRLEDPDPTRGGQFGWAIARTDYDRDGRPDLYIGQAPHHLASNADQNGGTYVMRGSDGAPLKAFEVPAADRQPTGVDPPDGNQGPNLGWGLAAPGDFNADGEPDYVAGAPFMDVGTALNQGRMYAFLSREPAPDPQPPADPPIPPADPLALQTPLASAPVPAARDTTRPVVSTVDMLNVFSRGSLLPRLASQARVGTRIRFQLSEPATARLSFARARSGRRVGSRCRAPSRSRRSRPRCTRYVTVNPPVVVSGARAGASSVRFEGRLSRSRTLRPGRYRLTITATDAAGNRSRPRATTFRLLPRTRCRAATR